MNKNLLGKKIALILFSAIFSFCVFAQTKDVKSIIPAEYYEELSANKMIIKATDGSNGFLLLPESDYSEKIRNGVVKKEEKNFPFVYEGLYLINKDETLKKNNSNKTNITIDDVSKICRSISEMQGMVYYSNRRNSYEVLYEKAYMIDEKDINKRNPDPIPDQNYGNADGQISYCLQDDSSFGKNKYRLSYSQNENEFFTEYTLIDKMGFGPFNALYPGKLKINILVIDCGENIVLYLCTDVDSKKFPGIEGRINDSMTARMEAVYSWFISKL